MKYTFFIALIGISFLFSSCGTTKKAEAAAQKFMKFLVRGQMSNALGMAYSPGIPKSDVLEALNAIRNHPQYGVLKSAKQQWGFNTQMNNGVTTVTLNYLMKYENGDINAEVMLVDMGGGFKVVSVGV